MAGKAKKFKVKVRVMTDTTVLVTASWDALPGHRYHIGVFDPGSNMLAGSWVDAGPAELTVVRDPDADITAEVRLKALRTVDGAQSENAVVSVIIPASVGPEIPTGLIATVS